MRTSIFCILALLALPAVINAQYTTSLPDNSTDQETTAQVNPTTQRPFDAESNDVLTKAIYGLVQEALRSQDQRAQSLMEQQLKERDLTVRTLLDKQVNRIEKVLKVLADQLDSATKKVGNAAAHEQIDQMEKKLLVLEASVERILKHLGLEAPSEQLVEPSAEHGVATSSHPPAGEEATEWELTEEDERVRQRLQLRVREAKEKRDDALEVPSTLGEDLCTAAGRGRTDEVRRLLDAGADVNYVTTEGVPALLCAFYLPPIFFPATPDVVALFVERGADVNATTTRGASALHAAVYFEENKRCVEMLLGAGADVDARDENGATPLHWAAYHGNEQILRALLAGGARKDLRCWSGEWKNKIAKQVSDDVDINYALMD